MTAQAQSDQAGRTGSTWPQPANVRRVSMLVAVAILVVLAGVGASAHIGGSRSVSRVATLSAIGDAGVSLVVVAAVLVLGLLAWALRPRWRRKRGDEPPPLVPEPLKIYWWEKVVVLVVVLGALAAMVTGLVVLIRHSDAVTSSVIRLPSRISPSAPLSAGSRLTSGASSLLHPWPAAVIVAGAIVGASLILLLLRVRNHPDGDSVDAGGRATRTVALAALAALDELRAERDPRLAVVHAYAAMERVLSQRGLGRNPHEAPFEYLERALTAGGAPAQAALELTELFELARFSEHTIGPSLRDEALQALETIGQSEVE
jgi:hypothetical protein